MPWSTYKEGPFLQFIAGKELITSPYRAWDEASFSSVQKRKRPAVLSAPSSMTFHSRSSLRNDRGMFAAGTLGSRPINLVGSVSASSSRYSKAEKSATDQAASKLRLRLKDQTWNAATTFGELGETLSFFVGAAKDLRQTYRLAAKGDLLGLSEFYRSYDMHGRRRKPPYKRVADRWLQWRYAVRPLAADLQDVLTEFYRSGATPRVSRSVGRGVEVTNNPNSSSWQTSWGVATLGGTATVTCRYVCTYTLKPALTSWKRLGLLNVPALLWELTPGSFLMDVVLPVGTWLNGLDADVGIEQVSTTKSVKFEIQEELYINGGRSTSTLREYYRLPTEIPSQPLPAWRVSDHDLKNRVADVLALLTQTVKRR